MIKPVFGRSKWGQNDAQLFITIYCPGVDVSKVDSMLNVEEEKFHFEAVDPVNNEKSTVSFDFREPVDAASMTVRPGTWKYGNANNTVFITIKKQIPHLFDRLTFAKPTKAFKKMMEKDWDRYTVNDKEGDEEEDEDEDEDEDDQDVKRVTDESYDKDFNKASIMALKVLYPWCEACKNNKVFDDAAKKQKKLAKKGGLKGVRYGRVDARENRKIRKLVGAHCPETKQCQDHVYITSKSWSEKPFRYNGTDFSAEGISSYVDRIGSPSPREIASLPELNHLEKRAQNVILGVFNTKTDATALAAFKAVAEKQRMSQYFGLVTEEGRDLDGWLKDALTEGNKGLVIDKDGDTTAKGGRVVVLSRFGDEDKNTGRSHVHMYGQREVDVMEENEIATFVNSFSNNKGLVPYQRADITPGAKLHLAKGLKHVAHLWLKSGSQRIEENSIMAVIRKVAQAHHRDVAFMVHDEVKETGSPVIGRNVSDATKKQLLDFGLDGGERPLFAIESFSEKSSSFDQRYPMPKVTSKTTVEEFNGFIQEVTQGKATPALRSEPLSEVVGVGGLRKVVGTQLEGLTKEGGSGLISFHYGEPHTDGRQKELQLVAKVLAAIGSPHVISQCSLTYNAVTQADAFLQTAAKDIKLAFYAGEKVVAMPHGNQTAEAIMEFLLTSLGEDSVTSPLMSNLKLQRAAIGNAQATVFEHGDLAGWNVAMERGDYDIAALREIGVRNDDLSSVRVGLGAKVTLYEHGNFTGWECILREGDNRVAALETAFCKNDEASAIRVEPSVQADTDVLTASPSTCEVNITGTSSFIRGGVWRASLINGKTGTDAYSLRGGINDEPAQVTIPEGCHFTTFEHDFGPGQEAGWTRSFAGTGEAIPLEAGASAFSIMGKVKQEEIVGADDASLEIPESSTLLQKEEGDAAGEKKEL